MYNPKGIGRTFIIWFGIFLSIVVLIQGFPPKTNLLYPFFAAAGIAYFSRPDSFSTRYRNRAAFVDAMKIVLQKSYRLEESRTTLLFRPKSSVNRFFDNDVYVELDEGIAIIHCGANMKGKLQRELIGKGL
jgi:hypothetical protein